MKNYMLLVLSVVTISSCKKLQENPAQPQHKIVVVKKDSTATADTIVYKNNFSVAANGTPTISYAAPSSSSAYGILTMTIPFVINAKGPADSVKYIPYQMNVDTIGSGVNPKVIAGPFMQCAVYKDTSLQKSGIRTTINYPGNLYLIQYGNGNAAIQVNEPWTFEVIITDTVKVPGTYHARLVNVNFNSTNSADVFTPYTYGFCTSAFTTPSYVVQ